MTKRSFSRRLVAMLCLLSAVLALPTFGQTLFDRLSGAVQSDVLVPQKDAALGLTQVPNPVLSNSYLDLNLSGKYLEVGGRYAYLRKPLPGYETDFRGSGIPFFYVKGRYKQAELTLGTIYEQFGSGLIFRSYEDRGMGVDNSLRGGRFVFLPTEGVRFKALAGKSTRYWSHNDALLVGADLELDLDRWLQPLARHQHRLTLGLSAINKHEASEDIMVDATHKLRLPESVGAFDVRLQWQHRGFNVLGEYAQKSQDPSLDNGYIYRRGYVALLSASYSHKGLSVLVQSKRSVNMGFRSARSAQGNSSFVNHLPAFTMEHTYALPSQYPYATQPNGEWAYQASLGYAIPKRTLLGGRYGTQVKLNVSHVHAIARGASQGMGSDGYGSPFWRWGDATYYQDINLQVEKKFSPRFKLDLMYMNQRYNQRVIEGEGGMLRGNIFVAEGRYKFSAKHALRAEAQYMAMDGDQGDWLFGLLEYSVAPQWSFTLSDMYNAGTSKLHYYQGAVTYSVAAHRIQLGYGRTNDGYNCSGGVCRYVPATSGVSLSYNYSF